MLQLTEEEKEWQDNEMFEYAKKILSPKKYNEFWKNTLSKRPTSGPCVYTCRCLMPKSAKEFFETAGNINSKMTKESFENIARKWKEKTDTEDEIPFKYFYYGVINHNCIETFEGHIAELTVRNSLIKNGFTILNADDRMDTKLGVDIIAEKNGKIYYIQVKVVSFFLGMQPGQVDHRRKVFTKSIPNQIKENAGKTLPKYVWVIYDYLTKKFFHNPYTNNFQFDVTKVIDTSDTDFYRLSDDYKKVFLTYDEKGRLIRENNLPKLNQNNMFDDII